MSENTSETAQSESRTMRKVVAIAAGLLVVGVGVTYTLASWSDAEWVWGGLENGDPGIATDEFEVVQNRTSAYDNAAANWEDHETNPGGALSFTSNALSLTPGDTTYAPVALRTVEDSLAADVTLQGAVPAAGTPSAPQNDSALFDAVRVSVYTATAATPPSACAAGFTAAAWGTPLLNNVPLNTAASAAQSLAADGASTQHYCFALTLPSDTPDVDDLQGLMISPAWQFASESVAP